MDKRKIDELHARRSAVRSAASGAAIEKLRAQGKLTARERLALLLDDGSFVEMGIHAHSAHASLRERTPADGIVTGYGTIDGRIVYVAADDATVLGGTRGRVGEIKIARVREAALKHRKPFIALMEAGAARVQESFGAMAANMGARFGDHFRMSGQIPQLAAILGPAFGGPSFTAAQSDFTALARGTGVMGMSGPLVVKVGTGELVTSDAIGGAEVSETVTGQADYVGDTEADTLQSLRTFLSFLPSHCGELPPVRAPQPAAVDTEEGREKLRAMIPDIGRQAYDMKRVLSLLVDAGDVFHYRPKYGPNLITALGRIDGQPVGFLASNPMARGGVMDEKTAQKARKFVDLCDAFHVPLVFICDAPGFLVGPDIEKHRMVSLAARLLNTVCAASVPKVTIVARKAIGLAYLAMCGRTMRPDYLAAWPGAHFDVMGPEAGVELVYGREIAGAPDPGARKAEIMAKLDEQSSAYEAAAQGWIDDVIDPAETRDVIRRTLRATADARVPGFKHRIDP
ncbi:acyl-CoA carboxylase subunit beta [Pandoraea fibrosis]|uniref:Methylmalonyl-CoA carboxyltransferase n=1 Tax=Pandoraea fibrosis TaxID=1891094 RepID=A0A5E4S438_9BURK|nr:carboxyl transferase domain-containing protein [Pandoraea fibrosis]QHE92581.1 methylmalonyl-CoA carboxyltransferase [Pandoraea fibrosis]QHF13863.1 methylmalonyl-CoA carboxyltransferase [Pandoraea fibrosis]VVD69472.1 Methylmalonyl-CoA carboxyltransferase 12S subunit [Pandoraea fibrosis]